jgi:hypothetical protein
MASEAKPSSRRAQTRQAYLEAVEGAFGADVDHAMLNKIYGGLVRERQGPLQPRRLHRDQDTGCHRKAGHGACLYVLRRAVKSHNADAQPAFYTADECVLQKIREPRPYGRNLGDLVQLHPHPQDASRDARDGCGFPKP